MQIRLVVFDMDGVIFEGRAFWLDLHEAYGTAEAGSRLFEAYGDSEYMTLARLVANRLWKGKPAVPYLRLIEERAFHPGVHRVFGWLRRNGFATAILSSGSYELAVRAQRELQIGQVRANSLEIEGGVLTGRVTVMVDDANKDTAGMELVQDFGVSLQETCFVGDSESDASFAEKVGLPIAYDSNSDRLSEACLYRIPHDRLEDLIDVLANP